ncbi:MAG: ABC transporter ATP-binding protein [Treponema sp.]|nr:ABC transporter ATP-binding protein [Treponema sp.]
MSERKSGPSGAPDFALQLKNFSFQYTAQVEPTLYGIDLSVKKGEKILILGPSGSGKSTLIHCINGLAFHAYKGRSSGVFTLLGRDPRKLDIFEISKRAGTVLQDTDGQFVGLSAAEDIAFAAENDCVPPAELRRRVEAAAAQVGMSGHLAKAPQDLSGGQKQRVSIAGVLMDEVDLLLFDEPLANLEPAAGKETIELIDLLHKERGKTIVIVEHRLEDALHRPVDRIVLFDGGRVIADLPPAELLASDLLRKAGIREPLYLGALRYAGVEIKASVKPQSLETLTFDPAPLKKWAGEAGSAAGGAGSAAGEEAEPLLEIRNISFSYGRSGGEAENAEAALYRVSFSVGKGECMSLVGENGAGKSTLAKIICGFLKPDLGSVFFDGTDIAGFSIMERAERIAYVMQNPNQMISCPMIFDETALGLRTRGVGEGETKDRVYEALMICGLYPFRNWPVSALSYGQKKRLTIAAILVLNPRFIIMDEPTAGQDYRHYTEFMEFLRGLNNHGGGRELAMLLITHDMHLMLEYTRRAAVLSAGKCIAVKESAELLSDDELIEKARLKRTSLYDLALIAGLPDPRAFIRRFIAHEEILRKRTAP